MKREFHGYRWFFEKFKINVYDSQNNFIKQLDIFPEMSSREVSLMIKTFLNTRNIMVTFDDVAKNVPTSLYGPLRRPDESQLINEILSKKHIKIELKDNELPPNVDITDIPTVVGPFKTILLTNLPEFRNLLLSLSTANTKGTITNGSAMLLINTLFTNKARSFTKAARFAIISVPLGATMADVRMMFYQAGALFIIATNSKTIAQKICSEVIQYIQKTNLYPGITLAMPNELSSELKTMFDTLDNEIKSKIWINSLELTAQSTSKLETLIKDMLKNSYLQFIGRWIRI